MRASHAPKACGRKLCFGKPTIKPVITETEENHNDLISRTCQDKIPVGLPFECKTNALTVFPSSWYLWDLQNSADNLCLYIPLQASEGVSRSYFRRHKSYTVCGTQIVIFAAVCLPTVIWL
jgi:hypothetical protein